MTGRGWTLLLGVVMAATACNSDDDGSAEEVFCRHLCETAAPCTLISSDVCESDCRAGSPTKDWSDSAARQLAACVTGFDCATLTDENAFNGAFQSCWRGVKPEVTVSPHTRRVCADFAEAYFECGAFASTADCERNLRMWSDAVLDAVESCLPVRCSALNACLEGVFGAP